MHRYLITILLPLLLLTGINCFGQQYVMIKGQVWDLTGENLVGAHAYNSTRHYGTFTDINGIFFLVMVPGDSLRVSMVGYKPYRMKIPSRLTADAYKLDVTLIGDTIILKTAEIKPYPATYAELRREFLQLKTPDEDYFDRTKMPDINYGSKYTNPNGTGIVNVVIPGPFTALYNAFSKEAKELKKMNKILEVDRLRERVINIMGRSTLEKKLGIKTDEQIDALITKCGLTHEFLDSQTEYDVIKYVLACHRRK